MKNLFNVFFPAILFLISVLPVGCEKSTLPTVITTNITGITQNVAICRGNITNDGGSPVTIRGVCWSTVQMPTITDNKTTDGSGAGNFISTLTGLIPNTQYYVRAYATNSAGTAYGSNIVSFSTNPVSITVPMLTTNAVTNISATGASSGGNIIYDGGSVIIASGICWSTSMFPTTANSKTIDGSDTGSFTSIMTELTPLTQYYVRSYATNIAGTSYGVNTESFISDGTGRNPIVITDIDGNIYQTVTIGTQIWMSENLRVTQYNDGTPIPNVSNASEWMEVKTGAYCNFNNEFSNAAIYGCMYNYYVINDSHRLCPKGWHVPTDPEWTTLETFLGYNSPIPGGNLKEAGTTHWISPNTGADNSSGFSALPGGYRDGSNGRYYYLGIDGYWWTSSEYYSYSAFCRKLVHYDAGVSRTTYSKNDAFSIRCIKD